MNRLKILKAALIAAWVVGMLLLFGAGGRFFSSTAAPDGQKKQPAPQQVAANPDDYVGSETCATCHEDRDKEFKQTAHSKLVHEKSWKGKVVGCESCHGPGKAHVEAGGDKTLIRTFQGETSKQVSDTCLKCHSGREEHSNYLRGEHWRNDVGCTDCHSTHGGPTGANKAASNAFVASANAEKPGFENTKMLKGSEQQLCLTCHSTSHGVGAVEPAGPAHNLSVQYRDCTACHTKIHGSHTSPVFMR